MRVLLALALMASPVLAQDTRGTDFTCSAKALALSRSLTMVQGTSWPWWPAPDHSTSRADSISSPLIPGSVPFTMNSGSFAGSPKILRKVRTSERLMLVRPTTAIETPDPSMPALRSGSVL